MGNMKAKLEIMAASKERMRSIKRGDPVTNICAGNDNPIRHCYFVEYKIRSRKNKYGITHKEYLARCTDGKKDFFNIDIDVIYPGHLGETKCNELFSPVWEAQYGGDA